MTPPPAIQSSSTFALAICLAIIVIPPILAAVLSAINALAKRYGEALLNLLDAICTATAYLAQLAMIVSALCCAYFGLDAVSIELDSAVPRIVAPAFFALVSLSLALGFVVFAIGGLYVVEYTVWSSAMKSPTELAIVVMMKTLVDATVEYICECFAVLQAFVRGSLTSKKAEEPVAEEAEDYDTTPDSESPTYASELSDSPLHIDDHSDIDQWK